MWRIIGGAAITACAAMTLLSRSVMTPGVSPTFLMLYWGAWLALLLVAMYCVWIDLRYLRAQFLAEESHLFRETLAEESFRKALIEAQREMIKEDQQGPPAG